MSSLFRLNSVKLTQRCFWIKERYESAVRRTLEKSQKAQQSLSQNARGRKLTKNGKLGECAFISLSFLFF